MTGQSSVITSGGEQPLLVRMRDITKSFGPTRANDHIDLDLYAGEIHALLGENGAGKTTLMHVLSGLLRADEGKIEMDGALLPAHDPRVALRRGIGMVHQHFTLVPTMTIGANIVLNDEPTRRGVIDEASIRAEIIELERRFGLEMDPDARVSDTSVSTQQKVEILKALRRRVRLLILDEPTAVLTPHEIRDLSRFLRELANSGVGVVLITHKLTEVLGLADRLTVLRDGRVVTTRAPHGLSATELASLMVGREVLLKVDRPPSEPGPVVLELRDVSANDDRGLKALDGVDLSCRAGEILGIAGVDGNGQAELVEVITGLRPMTDGAFIWEGGRIESPTAVDQIRRGIVYIPEDRQRRALVLEMSLAENIVLRSFRDPPVAHARRLKSHVIARRAKEVLSAYSVSAPPGARAGTLSGGNQQKIVVGRELSGVTRLVVAAQPTRGVDVGATQFVYDRLLEQRHSGVAILLISFDLDELLALSDRVAVIYGGRIVATLAAAEATEDRVGHYMTTGVRLDA